MQTPKHNSRAPLPQLRQRPSVAAQRAEAATNSYLSINSATRGRAAPWKHLLVSAHLAPIQETLTGSPLIPDAQDSSSLRERNLQP